MSRRGGFPACAVALALAGTGALATPAVAEVPVAPDQALVQLDRDHIARSAPSVRAHRIETVAATRPLTGARTVLPLLASRTTHGRRWFHVALPGRPSGHKGWITAKNTRRTVTAWQLRIDLSRRLVTAYQDGRALHAFSAVVGKPSTPTPRGRFFVEETMALASRDAGAPFALATSARSDVLQEFDGGPGQIAIHGTGNLAGRLGTAASHGCIRLGDWAIRWLAKRIGAGVPVTIVS